jgi:hypothetical protein
MCRNPLYQPPPTGGGHHIDYRQYYHRFCRGMTSHGGDRSRNGDSEIGNEDRMADKTASNFKRIGDIAVYRVRDPISKSRRKYPTKDSSILRYGAFHGFHTIEVIAWMPGHPGGSG